jgi:hypothetical protein
MRKINDILVEHCIKLTLLYGLRGNNYNKNEEKRINLESSRELANR